MKLNQRVRWVIIPVLLISYLLMFSAIYHFEKKSYLKQEQVRVELHLSQLASVFKRYTSFVDIYFSSLISSTTLHNMLKFKSDRLKAYAIERNLSSVISDLTDIQFNNLSLAIINAQGEIKYFYEGGQDPFSEPNSQMSTIVATMFANKQSHHKQVILEDKQTRLMKAMIINPITMRKPKSAAWQEDAVAVILLFDLTSFDQLKRTLKNNQGYDLNLSTGQASNGQIDTEHKVHGLAQFSDLLSVHINYDERQIEDSLFMLLLQLLLVAIILITFSSVLLVLLIERYITVPVQTLEKNIVAVNESGACFPMPTKAVDEIYSLQSAFATLYRQLKHSLEQTRKQAETDSLTQLHNRRKFNERFEGFIERADSDSSIALIYIDLDNFKSVNDNYGHKAGDVFLQEFAQKLESVVRLTDIVITGEHDLARLAGDEFAIIVHDFSHEMALTEIAQRILKIFSGGFNSSVGNFPVSASIGIAIYPRDGEHAKDLVVNADAAMYQAKRAGKNQFHYYSRELAAKARREQLIENQLRKQDFSEFELHYMPLIDANTNQLIGVEALLRWFSSELGVVSPAEFIPIAESRGLYAELDLWVFNRALDDLPSLQKIIGENGKLSINISSAQLESGEFFYQLMLALKNKGVTSTNLELEITETFEAVMSKRVESNLALLKQAGFNLALDDFGAGHTSLNQLVEYPVDVIKIDKSLIDHMLGGGLDLVVALIAFCKRLGFFVTAEGVETKQQAEALRKAGVDALQGYYFDKPLTLEEVIKRYG